MAMATPTFSLSDGFQKSYGHVNKNPTLYTSLLKTIPQLYNQARREWNVGGLHDFGETA